MGKSTELRRAFNELSDDRLARRTFPSAIICPRRAGNAFRTFVHPVTRIEALVEAAGFDVLRSCRTLVWAVLVCRRREAA
jgi:hypothetical protein